MTQNFRGRGAAPLLFGKRVLLVNLASVANVENQNDDLLLLDLRKYAVVSDAVAPLAATVRSESFAMLAGILAAL